MPDETSTPALHVQRWPITLELFEEGDETKAHAVLHTKDQTLESRASAHRNPHDASIPEIGDEYAAGRALVELGEQLIRAGAVDAARR
jgi:hypothetical protein